MSATVHFPLLNKDVLQSELNSTLGNISAMTGTSTIKDTVKQLALIEEKTKHKTRNESMPVTVHFPLLNRDVPQNKLKETINGITATKGNSKIKDTVKKLAIIEQIPEHKIKLIINGQDAVPLTIQDENKTLAGAGWNDVQGKNIIYLKVDMNNHYLDGIGGLHYSDKNYIGRTERLQEKTLTTQKRIDDSNKRLQTYHFQLVVWSMVGGISIITLLMLFRKFRKN